MYKILLSIIISVLLISCSAFPDNKQKLTLLGENKVVRVNNDYVKTPITIEVDRDKPVSLQSYNLNNQLVYSRTLVPKKSIWGKLDQLGTFFLYPGFGVFFPGSMELETETVIINHP